MKRGRDVIIAIMITFCFTACVFMVMPINSSNVKQYNPWFDLNDDGKINLSDLVTLATDYGTNGTPITKTALLLDLENRVDGLNSDLSSLGDQVNLLTTYNYTWANDTLGYGSASTIWFTIPNMTTTITVAQPSLLKISMTTVYFIGGANLVFRTLVDSQEADPGEVSALYIGRFAPFEQEFFMPNVTAGTHTVQVQIAADQDTSGGLGIKSRTLFVSAYEG